MSGDDRFSLDWLRLRAEADLAARHAGLARRFAAALPRRDGGALQLLDLAAGSGANVRALLPRIAGDQTWHLLERDPALLAAQAEEFTLWARRQGYPIIAGGGRTYLETGAAQWQIATVPLDLAAPEKIFADTATDGVAASAFFDLVSTDWIGRFVSCLAAAKVPLLAALTVDGRRLWEPALAEDRIVAAAFARHQQRDKGFGTALGGNAAAALAASLEASGFAVEAQPSDWRLGLRDRSLLAALIAGEAQAAQDAAPVESAAIERWRAARLSHLADGSLRVTVGHRDLLALPKEPGRP